MKAIILTILIALSCGVEAAHPHALVAMLQKIYPTDASRRQALDMCFMADHQFNRLDPAAREACYRRFAQNLPSGRSDGATPPAATVQQANFVDLWRAAGQGRLPQNDIRFQQQNDRFLHPFAGVNQHDRDAPPLLREKHRAPPQPAVGKFRKPVPSGNTSAAVTPDRAWPAVAQHRV